MTGPARLSAGFALALCLLPPVARGQEAERAAALADRDFLREMWKADSYGAEMSPDRRAALGAIWRRGGPGIRMAQEVLARPASAVLRAAAGPDALRIEAYDRFGALFAASAHAPGFLAEGPWFARALGGETVAGPTPEGMRASAPLIDPETGVVMGVISVLSAPAR